MLDGGLVKTQRFKHPRYVGDPINAVKIFNEKEVDELILLDIGASRQRSAPDFAMIADLASEAFMPIGYGGGVADLDTAARLSGVGIEKIILDSGAIARPALVGEIAARLGSSSTVVSITVKRDWRGRPRLLDPSRRALLATNLVDHARSMVAEGAGELMINDSDRDGGQGGLDLDLVAMIAGAVEVPLIACGGAGKIADLASGVAAGASAVAAGSQFVFVGPHRAVLINYPDEAELGAVLP